jgi:tRNA-dihydrouridine synthase
MKQIEDLPIIGYLKVIVYFDGYKDSYQNDTRRKLDGSSEKIKGLNQYITDVTEFDFEPETFSLLKKVVGKQSRSYAASHSYRYQVESSDDLKKLADEIEKWFESHKTKWWRRFELEYCEIIKR